MEDKPQLNQDALLEKAGQVSGSMGEALLEAANLVPLVQDDAIVGEPTLMPAYHEATAEIRENFEGLRALDPGSATTQGEFVDVDQALDDLQASIEKLSDVIARMKQFLKRNET